MSAPRPVTWGTSDQRRRDKWALGVTVGAVVFVTSYGGQRLLGLALGEPALGEVIRTAHTPFFWRIAIATLHAGIALPLAALLVPDGLARPLLRFGPLWVIGPVMVLALAMVAFP